MRLALPHVIAVEIWDLPVAGRMLQAWRDDPSFPARVAEAVVAVRRAPPPAWSPRARLAAPQIAHAYITGGGAGDHFARELARRGLACTLESDPFAAVRAGAAFRGAPCADLGQTGVKLVAGTRAWRIARDLARAPLRDGVPPADRAAARATTLGFVAAALRELVSPESIAPRILLGLPCELTPDGVPRGCTYCWPDPDPALVGDLAKRCGVSIDVANDAELAAIAAERDARVPHGTTLVLTIGFGVGAALLTGRPPTSPA